MTDADPTTPDATDSDATDRDAALADAGPTSTTPSGSDVEVPFPIDRGDDPDTPGSYRGLPLRLVDNGEPVVEAVDGRIGVVCIGPSFANLECGFFERQLDTALADQVSTAVVFVNCGVGGAGVEAWTDPARDAELWGRCIDELLPQHGLRADQVRVIFHKSVDGDSRTTPLYPDIDSGYFALQAKLDAFAARLPGFFPAVTAVYAAARSYGGYDPDADGGEPRAYESGHAVNTWLRDHPSVDGVWYGWGPYLWAPECATGVTNGSGVCYERADYLADGVHPGPGARQKVADMLHARWSEHAWYRP